MNVLHRVFVNRKKEEGGGILTYGDRKLRAERDSGRIIQSKLISTTFKDINKYAITSLPFPCFSYLYLATTSFKIDTNGPFDINH